MAASPLASIGKMTELRQRILFVLGAMVVFRVGTHIPIPGVDPTAVAALFEQTRGSIVDIFNMFSGGALERLSIFALGVMPYISASIIVQMMTSVIPQLEALKKEGEAGRRRLLSTRVMEQSASLFSRDWESPLRSKGSRRRAARWCWSLDWDSRSRPWLL